MTIGSRMNNAMLIRANELERILLETTPRTAVQRAVDLIAQSIPSCSVTVMGVDIVQHLFLWPFYVYAYNFAQLVVLSLYQKYLEEGDTFKPVYYRILETGSAMTPAEILGLAGIDPRDRAFWQKGFDFMRTRWVEPLEKLVADRK